MRHSYLVVPAVLAGILVLGLSGGARAQPLDQKVVFSVDDFPVMPMTPPAWPLTMPPMGWGAEDPFGTGAVIPLPLAPSPSIPLIAQMYGPTWDSTILQTGTILGMPFPDQHLMPTMDMIGGFPLAYVNAMSRDNLWDARQDIPLWFSVDRVSQGWAGTAVSVQAGLNQQPGDVFALPGAVPNPAQFIGLPINAGYLGPLPTAGMGPGTNNLLIDESLLTLTAGMGPGNMIGPGLNAPPIALATHDNLDALAAGPLDLNGDGMADLPYLVSVNPDEAAELTARYGLAAWGFPFSAADMYVVLPGMPAAMPAMPGIAFGLDLLMGGANIDDVDALQVIWDPATGQPCALFSLGPGSASLAQWNLSAADIFFTDFNGSFATFLTAADLGLQFTDNVDAIPEPATLTLLAVGGLLALRRRRR